MTGTAGVDGGLSVARGREIRRELCLEKMTKGRVLEVRWAREGRRGLVKG
jgi:hypothetical protein